MAADVTPPSDLLPLLSNRGGGTTSKSGFQRAHIVGRSFLEKFTDEWSAKVLGAIGAWLGFLADGER